MITIVYYDEYDSKYSEKSGEFDEAISDSAILTVTEDLNDSFDAVEKHQNDNKDSEIDYNFEFWRGGERFASICVVAPIRECIDDIKQHLQSFLH
ncbi:hypothetical protein JC221_059 [Yersinia phage JC221]|nr:hypothetical protein JC221_059 [Yersinia phage JC221]